jgi:protoporphyrin/coproporphyrin ferrochelatase
MLSGLLLLAHGTPSCIEDIPQFLSNIRRGRPTPAELVAEVQRRYQAIGGSSPLLQTTVRQAEQLALRMRTACWIAMRMWHPYFHETLAAAAEQGIERMYTLVMAPHSAATYEAALREAAAKLSSSGTRVPQLRVAPSIGSEPALIDAYADLTRQQLVQLSASERARTVLIPSAHSMPVSALRSGDPYPELVHQNARQLLERLGDEGLSSIVAFQSQGMASGEWLGPDLPTAMQRARDSGALGVVVVPIGFLVDHVETLYDLDIEALQLATQFGLSFRRAACPNASDGLLDALENVARRLMSEPSDAAIGREGLR